MEPPARPRPACGGPKVSGLLAKSCIRPPDRPRPHSPPCHRMTLVNPLRSFASVLMAPMRELDVCSTNAKEVVLACERFYKGGVDGALSEENERGSLMLLRPQDTGGDTQGLQDRPSPTWQEFLNELSA